MKFCHFQNNVGLLGPPRGHMLPPCGSLESPHGTWGSSAGSWGPTRAQESWGPHEGPTQASGPPRGLLGTLRRAGLLGPHAGSWGHLYGSRAPTWVTGPQASSLGPTHWARKVLGVPSKAPGAQHGFRGPHASSCSPQIQILRTIDRGPF